MKPASCGVVRLWTKTAETLWDLDEFPSATTTASLTPSTDRDPNEPRGLNDFAFRTPAPASSAPPAQKTRTAPAQQTPKAVWAFNRFASPSPSPCLTSSFASHHHTSTMALFFSSMANKASDPSSNEKKKQSKVNDALGIRFWREDRGLLELDLLNDLDYRTTAEREWYSKMTMNYTA